MTRSRRRCGNYSVDRARFRDRHKSSFWNGGPVTEVIDSDAEIDLLAEAEEERVLLAYEDEAAADGDLDLLEKFYRINARWHFNVCSIAAKNGDLDFLKYAHAKGAEFDLTCDEAARGGHLECLKYAHENGADCDIRTCCVAAFHGHLDCLKYILVNVASDILYSYFKFDDDGCVCIAAAKGGHLECLEFADTNGSQITWECCFELCSCLANEVVSERKDDFMRCLKYVVKNGSDSWYSLEMTKEQCWSHSSVSPWIVDAYVGNFVDDIFCRVVESLERERAAVVIQRRWLNHIYSPGARSTAMKRLADDFASRI